MTTRLDDAVIKLRIDTAAAEKRLKDMKESQSKVEKESEGIKQAVEKKRAQDRKERRAGRSGSMFGGLFGRARAGGRVVRGAAGKPRGALGGSWGTPWELLGRLCPPRDPFWNLLIDHS